MAQYWRGKSQDGQTVTLKKLGSPILPPEYATDEWIKINADIVRSAIAIDVETTGLNRKEDKVIELGARRFLFNERTGEILGSLDTYQGFQDPGAPLSEEIKQLTGITDEDVRGQSIDWKKIDQWIAESSIVIAHNAAFDRPFIEKHSPAAGAQLWGCSLKQIDWAKYGHRVQKLEILGIYHGFFWDSHRALTDVDALIRLIGLNPMTPEGQGEKTYLHELFSNAQRPVVRVMAIKSPFSSKDLLKAERYTWDVAHKFWQKFVYRDELEAEVAWLEKNVYIGEFAGMVQEIPLHENFRGLA